MATSHSMNGTLQMTHDTVGGTVAFFKTLSDPNRLQIFAQLMRGDTCNCELAERLGMQANLLSHHLKVLSEAGLITSRRDQVDGRWIYYSINRAAVARWQVFLQEFLDPSNIEERPLCGPEGQCEIETDRVGCLA